jgi:VanZ family protein
VYGSLFPLIGWTIPDENIFTYLDQGIPYIGRSDFILNILVYLPIGLFYLIALRQSYRASTAMILATLIGVAISFSMETLQVFLPNRTPAIVDLITNIMGTFFGVSLGFLSHENTFSGQKLLLLRQRYFLEGSWVNLGLVIVGLWALMHLSPLVVTLDVGKVRAGLSHILNIVHNPTMFKMYTFLSAFSYFIGLYILVRQLVKSSHSPIAMFFYFSLFVLLAKVFVVNRQASLEQISALFAATFIAVLFVQKRTNSASIFAVLSTCAGYVFSQLAPGSPGILMQPSEFTWMPFGDQIATLKGITSILENLWPFMTMSYLLCISIQKYHHRIAFIVGSIFIITLSFTMEWIQQYIPGRTADITAVFVAFIGWILPWNVNFYKYSILILSKIKQR